MKTLCIKLKNKQNSVYVVRKQIRGVIDEIMSFLPTPIPLPQTQTSYHLRLRRHLIGLPPILNSVIYGRSLGWFSNPNTVSKQSSSKSNTSWCFIMGRGRGCTVNFGCWRVYALLGDTPAHLHRSRATIYFDLGLTFVYLFLPYIFIKRYI